MPKPNTQTKCTACESRDIEVLDTRETEHGRRRRRGCLSCGGRWTTYEISAEELMELKTTTKKYHALLRQALRGETA